MPRATVAWEISSSSEEPTRLFVSAVGSEERLEKWIAGHPEILRPGLTLLARQLETGSGPLDLLCLGKTGQLVVVELKQGDAYREAFAQALDYTAALESMPFEEFEERVNQNRSAHQYPGTLGEILRRVLDVKSEDWTPASAQHEIVIAAEGADESLRRMVAYAASRYELPVNGVFFDAAKTLTGNTLLVRTAVVSDEQALLIGRMRGRGGITSEELFRIADERGTRTLVTTVLSAWKAATGREGRPERKERIWSLAKRSMGSSTAAYVYPYDNLDRDKKAWVYVLLKAMAQDLSMSAEDLKASIEGAGLVLEDDVWIDISTPEAAGRVATWIADVYSSHRAV